MELLWVDNSIEAFFLEIQGSGRIILPDGSMTRVGFAGQNGHPYVAIGKELIRRNEIRREDVSLPTIRAWLTSHPDQAQIIMNLNPSYVFFREITGEGPIGSENVPLTPGRSLAVDYTHVPLGVPIWLDAETPLASDDRLQRLLVAQDTGGAIRGPIRGDVFWGHGKDAEQKAGYMKSRGRYFLLLPRLKKNTKP
ncbi:membrane-bound lytic murein transglycosylase A [Azospirillaceae bacterium]